MKTNGFVLRSVNILINFINFGFLQGWAVEALANKHYGKRFVT
jgi:hypothetical protein